MRIINGNDDYYIKEGTVVTIGKFDGVHKGHQKLIEDVVSRAKVSGLRSCVITFENDPSDDETTGKRLTTFEEKKRLIEDIGVDILVVFKLSEEFMRMNPYAFIDSVLVDKLNMQAVSIGSDFRFGHKREGKANTFVKAAMIYGYGINVLEKEESGGKPVSSTEIRAKLSEGDIGSVNEMLGRHFNVTGITAEGKKIGRDLGFPTMNLYPDKEKMLPPNGVYATEVLIGGKVYKAVTNVGVRPTVSSEGEAVSVESHLLGFKSFGGNDYDKIITVSFLKRIRDEKKFDSKEELADQIKKDIEEINS